MSPAEPWIAQADIETTIRVNDKALKLLAIIIPMFPCHPRRTARGGARREAIRPARGNTGSECEVRPSIPDIEWRITQFGRAPPLPWKSTHPKPPPVEKKTWLPVGLAPATKSTRSSVSFI